LIYSPVSWHCTKEKSSWRRNMLSETICRAAFQIASQNYLKAVQGSTTWNTS
jgi:hypothetical protein